MAGRRRKPKRQRSLAGRLVLVAAVWSALALAIGGVFVVSLHNAAGERAFDAQLDVHLKSILAEMLPDAVVQLRNKAPEIKPPRSLGEPRFSLPLSGWYWTVRKAGDDDVLFSSPSLVGDPLNVPELGTAISRASYATGPGGREIRVLQRRIEYDGHTYIIAVAAAASDFRKGVNEFARSVALTLLIIGIALVGAIFLQVKVGLRPLVRLRESLSAVREGKADRIDEDLPSEIAPLAIELNALIVSNHEIVERARTHVGNLAHGLKTPLSVIANEAASSKGPFADKVAEQAKIMSTQIQHHLERARMAAQRRVIGVATEVEPALDRLERAMVKIHGRRLESMTSTYAEGLKFRGEKQDLEEMAGNLLDNACKWAGSRVAVTVRPVAEAAPARAMFELIVEDDGPGLSEDECKEAVKRGRRLDETVPGTGLGLSIVADLAALYGGDLTLGRSKLGGLKARLVLPLL
ncbi:histidine kinase [Roseibium sp. RKSG952]|nr:ATP-binding protein [Roseibium sp. RKSG952]MTH98932.1 histidine kinase [Roseibium sp. RKSG952]